MNKSWIIPLADLDEKSHFCRKSNNLLFLQNNGFKVPETIVCSDPVFEFYLSNSKKAIEEIRARISELIDYSKSYVVSHFEDDARNSSIDRQGNRMLAINLKGVDSIVHAIESFWGSIKASPSRQRDLERPYRAAETQPHSCVIIQEAIEASLSGIVLTRNPITGSNEIVVETYDTIEDLLLKSDASADRWVIKTETYSGRPKNIDDREQIVYFVVEKALQIASLSRSPVILEWAYDGKEIYWLRMDEITGVRQSVLYSNRLSREFLPGMIKPLVWSINIPVVNSSWKTLFQELIGPAVKKIEVDKMARSFYYRAYFNMSVVGDIFEMLGISREALEILSGIEKLDDRKPVFRPNIRIIKFVPRMLGFVLMKLFYSKQIETFLRQKTKQYAKLAKVNPNGLGTEECLSMIDSLLLLNTESSYVVIISQLLNSIYNRVLNKYIEKTGFDTDEIEFTKTKRNLSRIDPQYSLSTLHSLYTRLPEKTRNQIEKLKYKEIIDRSIDGDPVFREFGRKLDRFMKLFGHLSDSGNDFSTPTWKEYPYIIKQIIIHFKPSEHTALRNREKANFEQVMKKKPLLKFFCTRAAKYHEYRETVSFVYSFGYGLFRKFFLRIGGIFQSNGLIDSKNDVFYLSFEEIKALAGCSSLSNKLRDLVKVRKEEMKRYQNVELPEIIFDELPENALVRGVPETNLFGVPSSGGNYVGSAKVIKGIQDFGIVKQGDVLIIPFSDASWTPLFSKAGAIVSESGGILSHCSMVAREFGIPAVVSVNGALQIKNGSKVAVDGYRGEVTVMK